MTNRGISRAAIERFKIGWTGDNGNPTTRNRIVIPYLTAGGAWHLKYRCPQPHDCNQVGHPKYVYDEGAGQHLYNAQTLLHADRVAVTEGEIDAISVEMCGIPAVAYPGAATWKKNTHWRWCFDSVSEIVVICDGDPPEKNPRNNNKQPGDPGWVTTGIGEEAGRYVAQQLQDAHPDVEVRVSVLPVGHDSNSFIRESGGLAFLDEIGMI